MTILLHDVAYAARVLRRTPLATGAAVATLALGIGATSAIFSLVNAALLTPLPGLAHPDRLVTIGRTVNGAGFDNSSYPNYADLRDQNRVFSDVTAVKPAALSVGAGGHADRLGGAIVTSNYFRTLGVRFARGGGFDPSAPDVASGPAVAVISHRVWRQQLGGDPSVVGRTISLNGDPFEIVGVTAPGFGGPDAGAPQDVWVPMWTIWRLRILAPSFSERILQNRDAVWIMLYGRVKPGVSNEQAKSEVAAIATRLQGYSENQKNGWEVAAVGLDPASRNDLVQLATMLFAAVGVLFLLACANVANLSLARAATRGHELSVRLAVGATRGRLIRQMLTESALLALAGGAGGLVVARGATTWLSGLFAQSARLPLAMDLSPDARVVLFTLAVACVAALLFGAGPALRSSKADLVTALKDAVALAPRRSRLRGGLVVVQLTLSIVLLIGAGLLLRTIHAYNSIDTGVDARDVTIATIDPSLTGRYDEARLRRLYSELLPRIQAIPGVQSAALGRIAPVTPRGYGIGATVLDRPGSFTESRGLQFNTVSTNYFDVLGIRVLRGRAFTAADTAASQPVVVLNDVAVKRLWPGEDPIRKQILVRGEPLPREVVGVVATIKYRNLVENAYPLAYYPITQPVPMPDAPIVMHVRSPMPVAQLSAALAREAQAIDSDLPVFNAKRLSGHMADSYWRQQVIGSFTTVLAVLALALGLIGVYGMMAFAAAERKREIGIRVALGATSERVVGMFLRDAARLLGLATVAGMALALAFSRLLSSLLLGVDPHDPLTFTLAAAVLGTAGLCASAAPALRASRVDPMLALRRQ